MKHTFRYIISSLVLLMPVLANAQTKAQVADPPLYADYKVDNGVATGKSVSDPDNGVYTVTLETFATGLTTMVDLTEPVDVVLVLDVSGSMDFPKGSITQLANNTTVTWQTINDSPEDQEYFYYTRYWSGSEYIYYWGRLYAERNGNNYVIRVDRDSNNGNGSELVSGNSPTNTYITAAGGNNIGRIATGISRMTALKKACKAFIDQIELNDHQDKNHQERVDEDGNPKRLHNRIAIVKFAGNSSNSVGNNSYDNNTENYSQVVCNLTLTEGNVQTLKDDVDALVSRGATNAGYGMSHANSILQNVTRNSVKTVVMFTDGEPTDDYVAITRANTTKGARGASVFTVGVFDESPVSGDNAYEYLNAVSSNYGSDVTFTYSSRRDVLRITGGTYEDKGYYKDASGDIDLTKIFEDIASASAGSASTVPGETKLVDAVSNSFEVPDTFHWDDVTVYTLKAKSDGSGWDESTKHILNTIELGDDYNLDALPPAEIAAQLEDEETVGVYLKGGKLAVIGFNYSKPDTEGVTPYDGNWVGWRGNGVDCAGKELVIEFDIVAQDGVTGGDGTNTNDYASSGIYVPKYNEDGSFAGYTPVNQYPYPQKNLPINIVIQKEGLRRGESATIQIYRAPIKANAFDPVTGKPAPDVDEDGNGWENFTKVILTNTTDEDNATVIKTLLCLDAGFVYRLKEDDWGWGYELDQTVTDTSKQETNPFIFVNKLDTKAVKHAEAVSINIFGDDYGSKTYKASKVQSY